jgi:nicotinamide mononucleotide adenylyltransferase
VEARHRVKMCELATESSDWIMVNPWESMQSEYYTTLVVLDHFYHNLNKNLKEGEQPIQVKLICGSDLLDSFNTPGVWAPEDVCLCFAVLSLRLTLVTDSGHPR